MFAQAKSEGQAYRKAAMSINLASAPNVIMSGVRAEHARKIKKRSAAAAIGLGTALIATAATAKSTHSVLASTAVALGGIGAAAVATVRSGTASKDIPAYTRNVNSGISTVGGFENIDAAVFHSPASEKHGDSKLAFQIQYAAYEHYQLTVEQMSQAWTEVREGFTGSVHQLMAKIQAS